MKFQNQILSCVCNEIIFCDQFTFVVLPVLSLNFKIVAVVLGFCLVKLSQFVLIHSYGYVKDKGPKLGDPLVLLDRNPIQGQTLYKTGVRIHQLAILPGSSSGLGTSEMCTCLFPADLRLCVATYTRLRQCVRLWR